MPNIKISDLPPITLPAVGDESFFEVQTVEAGQDVSRKISLDEIVSTTGLDASFLTVSANAQLPNERVLTEGTGISFVDTGPNGTLTINASGVTFPLLAPSGSAAAPSYAFTDGDSGFFEPLDDNIQISLVGTARFFWELDTYNAEVGTGPAMINVAASATVPGFVPRRSDPNTGLGSAGNDILSLIVGGVSIAQATSVGNNQFAIAQSGSSSVPELTSLADPDTGFRWTGANQLTFIGSGSRAWHFTSARFFSEFSQGPALLNVTADNDVPTVLADQSDANTGIGSSGNDEMSLIAGGVEAIRIDETAGAIQVIVDPGLTNTSDATPPLAFGGGTVGFRSPDSDQIFAILSGAAQWRFSTADFNANITDGPALRFVTPSGIVPSLLPNQNDTDTGIGQNAADDLSLIGGGVELARTITAATGGMLVNNTLTGAGLERVLTVSDITTPDPILLSDGSAAAPSYSFASDTDIGMFRVGADILGLSANSTLIAQVVGSPGADQFVVAPGAVQNNVSAPDLGFGDGDTGVMETVDDTIALVTGAVLAVRYARSGSGITQVNASATGLVASVTQTQAGGLALLSSYNEIATVANSGDALTAFPVLEGSRLIVINNGANDLQLFPDVGDDFGAGVDTAITIAAGEIGIFLGQSSTVWDTLKNAPATGGGDVIKVGTPVDNQVGVWTGDGTIEGTTGLTYDGSDLDITGNITLTGTVDGIDIAVDVAANTLKITNATHTGQVTGATALALDVTAITAQPAAGILIGADTFIVNDGGALSEITATQMATFFGNAIPGTVTNSMLRFDGADFIEETQVQVTAAGVFSVLDATLADSVSISHNGAAGTIASVGSTSLSFTGVATQYSFDNNVVVAGDITVAGGNRLIVLDAIATDSVVIDHDGTDGNIVSTLTADLNFTGVSVGYKFDESIYITEKTTANADFAGLGQFWTRDDVPNIPMFTNDVGIDFKLGVASDAVQARRTTSFTITTAFTDVTLDTTDIETDDQIIEHSGTTDNIEALVAGTYEVTYGADISPAAAGNDNIRAFGRVRLNDAGVDLPGSLASQSAFEDASTIGNQVFGRLQCSFIVVLAVSDFLTLQMMKVEIGGTGTFSADEVTVTVKRLL
jgi:hypothetical protein